MFARMAAAYVSRISRGSRVHSFITWWGDSAASTVTAEAPAGTPRSVASGGHGLSSSSSATQNVNFPGWPRVERSSRPGTPPSTLTMISRRLRPIAALARLPLPSTLWVAFIPRAARIGPLTTTKGALPPVLAVQPWRPYSGSHTARTSAVTTGMYSGRHPAITAAMATFSAVMRRRRTGSTPITSPGARRARSRNRRTSSSVGGTIGNPSVQPFLWNSSFASWASATSWPADRSGALMTDTHRASSRRVTLRPFDDLGVRTEPHARLGARVPDDLLEDPDARAIADDVRMHRELEDTSVGVGGVQLAPEHVEDVGGRRVGPERLEAMHHEVDRIVAHPL